MRGSDERDDRKRKSDGITLESGRSVLRGDRSSPRNGVPNDAERRMDAAMHRPRQIWIRGTLFTVILFSNYLENGLRQAISESSQSVFFYKEEDILLARVISSSTRVQAASLKSSTASGCK
jgi:hypothetical protein